MNILAGKCPEQRQGREDVRPAGPSPLDKYDDVEELLTAFFRYAPEHYAAVWVAGELACRRCRTTWPCPDGRASMLRFMREESAAAEKGETA